MKEKKRERTVAEELSRILDHIEIDNGYCYDTDCTGHCNNGYITGKDQAQNEIEVLLKKLGIDIHKPYE